MANIETLIADSRYYAEVAAPGTPASGGYVTYVKTDGKLYGKNDAGTEVEFGAVGTALQATILDAKGDLIAATAADTAARLAAGTNGYRLMAASGEATGLVWAKEELDYVAFTGTVSITATTEGTANTVVTGNSVAYDGSTIIIVEFFSPALIPQPTAGAALFVLLYEDSTLLGWIANARTATTANGIRSTASAKVRLTPTAASHTYTIKAMTTAGTSSVAAGAGGSDYPAGFIRICRAL